MSDELSVLVLTEDTGEHAHATISAVTRKLPLLLEPPGSVARAERPALRQVLAAVSHAAPAGGPGGP